MFKFELRIWFLLVGFLIIILLVGIFMPDDVNNVLRSVIKQVFFLALIIPLFSSQKMLIGLKPNSRVSNLKYIAPFIVILLFYAAIRSNFLNFETWSIGYIMIVLLVCYVQSLIEEVIFRGILINHYLKRGKSIWQSVLYSSILFGGFHLIALFGNSDLISVINQSLIAVMMGIFFSGIFLNSKNIYLTGLVHAFINIPTYFKIDENVEVDTNSAPLFDSPIVNIIMSSLILLLIYSPTLFSGIWLINKIKEEPVHR